MNDLNDLEDMKFEDSNAIKSFNDIYVNFKMKNAPMPPIT